MTPIMGRMAGYGSFGAGLKETWTTMAVLIMLWTVARSYFPGSVSDIPNFYSDRRFE